MTEKNPIVILFFNKLNLTRRCILSVLDSGYPADQIFCFDNGSMPDVLPVLQQEFPDLNFKQNQNNLGFSGGFNRALNWVFGAGSSSAFFLTNDTVIYPGALEACSDMVIKTKAGIVAPLISYLSHPGKIDSIGGYFDPVSATIHHYRTLGMNSLLDPATDYIPGTALFITQWAFEALGGTDENYHTYWEDVDLCFRAHQKTILLARCYISRIGHGVGQTCHKKPLYTTFFFQRNRIRFCKKFLSGSKLKNALATIQSEIDALAEKWQKSKDEKRLRYYQQLLREL